MTRIVRLGFEVRVYLEVGDGEQLDAQLTRFEAEHLELAEGQIVHIRAHQEPAFSR